MPGPADGQLMLGYIHAGWVRAEFMASVLQLQTSPARRLIGHVSAFSGGTLISYSRNRLAAEFLASPCEWLLMVDSDMAFSPVQVEMMVAAADPVERAVMSGLCATLDAVGLSTFNAVFTAVRDDTGTVTGFNPAQGLPAAGVAEVDGCGAAFLLLHRSVLEKIPANEWFRQGVSPSGQIRGEDLAFCLRATDAGFSIWVHTGVRPGHMKTVCLTAD